jgi:hypothetical protein
VKKALKNERHTIEHSTTYRRRGCQQTSPTLMMLLLRLTTKTMRLSHCLGSSFVAFVGRDSFVSGAPHWLFFWVVCCE